MIFYMPFKCMGVSDVVRYHTIVADEDTRSSIQDQNPTHTHPSSVVPESLQNLDIQLRNAR